MNKCTFLICLPLLTNLSFAEIQHGNAPLAATGIQVSGECLKKVAQDRGSVLISTNVVAATPREASEMATQSHEQVKAQVLRLQLKDAALETVNYNVMQECAYDQGKRVCKGYRATYATRFETSEIGRLGDVISTAAKNSAQEISDLQTFVSPAKLKTERESCLEIATRDAQSKALTLAQGAHVKLGKLRFLGEVGELGHPMPMMTRSTLAFSEAAVAAPTIESKPVDVRVAISATFDIDY
jgi:uncharacterized protein YggE